MYFTFLEENVERDAVHKALMSLLRQDVKGINFFSSFSHKNVSLATLKVVPITATIESSFMRYLPTS